MFTDHLGRPVVVDTGAYGPLRGLPQVGGTVPVCYPRTPAHGGPALDTPVSAVAGVRVVPDVDRGVRVRNPRLTR